MQFHPSSQYLGGRQTSKYGSALSMYSLSSDKNRFEYFITDLSHQLTTLRRAGHDFGMSGQLLSTNHEALTGAHGFVIQELAFSSNGCLVASPATLSGVDIFAFNAPDSHDIASAFAHSPAWSIPKLDWYGSVADLGKQQYTCRCVLLFFFYGSWDDECGADLCRIALCWPLADMTASFTSASPCFSKSRLPCDLAL